MQRQNFREYTIETALWKGDGVNGMREIEIKISLNKGIILVPKQGTEPVSLLKTDEEKA